jgi:hypothetical protein
MVAKLKAIKAELQRRMHDRMTEVGAWLRKVVLGYYKSVLVRRSQRAKMRWERLTPVSHRWIPFLRISPEGVFQQPQAFTPTL